MILISEILAPKNDAPLEEVFRCAVSMGYKFFSFFDKLQNKNAIYKVEASCIYEVVDYEFFEPHHDSGRIVPIKRVANI